MMDTIDDTPDEMDIPVARRTRRTRRFRRVGAPPAPADPAEGVARARGRPYSREVNWTVTGAAVAGVVAGALLGAGLALLFAPYSGEHARLALTDEFRRRRPWRRSPWDKLGHELAELAERRNRRSNRTPR